VGAPRLPRPKRRGKQQEYLRRLVASCRVFLLPPLLLSEPLRAFTRAHWHSYFLLLQACTQHAPQSRHGFGYHGHVHAPPTARPRRSGLCCRPAWLLMRAPLAHKWALGQVYLPGHGARGSVLGAFVTGHLVLLWLSYSAARPFAVPRGSCGAWSVCRSVCRAVLVRSQVRPRCTGHFPLGQRP